MENDEWHYLICRYKNKFAFSSVTFEKDWIILRHPNLENIIMSIGLAVKIANINYASLHNMKYAAIDYNISSLYCGNQIM